MNFNELKRTFIIAEIGINHEGDFNIAAELVKKASECGVDAVKFQTFTPCHYVASDQPERLERIKKYALTSDHFKAIAKLAKSNGLIFFSTPFHPLNADFLDEIQPIFKISSGDLTFLELITHVAKKGKPMIISTGLGTKEEIRTAIEAVVKARSDIIEKGELMLMHCVSAYPTPDEEANIANIHWLADNFNLPVGYSDHTLGIKACELSVAAGAKAIEKHFTYRKENQVFHDHAISADPRDLKELVQAVRRAEIFIGRAVRERGPTESKMLNLMRRSIAAAVDIPAGIPVKREWLTWLRPAWGIPPERINEIIGVPLVRNIKAGSLIKEEYISVSNSISKVEVSNL
ncbi:MAG: N-acetylneuraminate synthase family protein [Desulfobacterales bacterium]|nr:N-acetylneuraminate synthase family protein [Desulfobacterales bacterium]